MLRDHCLSSARRGNRVRVAKRSLLVFYRFFFRSVRVFRCDNCPAGYHLACLEPVLEEPPDGEVLPVRFFTLVGLISPSHARSLGALCQIE